MEKVQGQIPFAHSSKVFITLEVHTHTHTHTHTHYHEPSKFYQNAFSYLYLVQTA